MSDRPTGDVVDRELRRLVSDIASVPGPAPELDELLLPVPSLEGERTMTQTAKFGLIAAVAAAVAIIVGLLLFVDGDDNSLDTIDQPGESTTTTTSAPETSVTTAPTTSVVAASTEPEPTTIDPAVFADWQEYEDSTSRTVAADCAASMFHQRIGWTIGIDHWAFPTGEDADFEFLLDKSTVGEWLPQFEAWIGLRRSLYAELDPGSLDVLDGLTTEVGDVRATIDGNAEGQVDLGPMMVEWWFPYQRATQSPQCVFAGGNRRIEEAMQNFSSDSEAFGGRGSAAAHRCASVAAFRLVLNDIVERGTEVPLASRADEALALVESFWTDRPIDQAVVDIAARWRAIGFVDELATREQLTEVQGVLDDLLTYRASMPEGGILCPLDDGWEA
ncbi:MAG: hypothetical protein ACR2P0_19840 [Acidimicrobiales bacterium]